MIITAPTATGRMPTYDYVDASSPGIAGALNRSRI